MSSSVVISTLKHLATHGWITLRSMSPLLGYTHATGIYARQRSKNPIPTIKMGGTYRVYASTVVETLEAAPELDQPAAQTFLQIYRSFLRDEQEQENNE